MKSIKFIVTAEKGIQSTLELPINSKKIRIYPRHTILNIIQIQHVSSEQRIRGQIEKSLDWVSIKDSYNEFMWMKPVSEVTKTYNIHPNFFKNGSIKTYISFQSLLKCQRVSESANQAKMSDHYEEL